MQPARGIEDEEYAALIRSVATKVRTELDGGGDLDDLIAAGYLGLVEAQSRYDATRGVQFTTFAYYRIRGAMIDHVRKSANLSRRAYARLRQAESNDRVAEEVAEMRAADPASRQDLDATVATLDDAIYKLTATYILGCLGQDEDSQPGNPEAALLGREFVDRIRGAVESLPDRERALVTGHYFEGRRFDEVAEEIGVSKSWASRIHGKALERLRESLSGA